MAANRDYNGSVVPKQKASKPPREKMRAEEINEIILDNRGMKEISGRCAG